jgi:hypothetical protein
MTVATDVANTKQTITDQITLANGRTSDVLTNTFNAINSLNGVASEVPPSIDFIAPSINVNIPVVSGVGPSKPSSAISAIKAAIGATPGNFTASIDERAMQNAPQEQFSVPAITFPTSPVFDPLVKPSALAIALPDDIPDVPVVTLPTDLTVGDQTVPSIPTISLPSFGESLPTLSIDLPDTTFAYVEPVYTSALKTAITTKLLDGVQSGGTGLGATVQTDIWNKDIERLNQQKEDDIEEVTGFWGGRGFDQPPGMLNARISEIQDKHTFDRSQNSRTISIEEARIAKEMTQFFLSTGLSLEQIELNHANNVANRALEAEKAVVQFSIDLYNSKVTKFNLELARYQAKQIEVETKLKIQELVLAQYQAELQGVDIQVRQDSVKIENYRALLASHDINIKLYEAEIGAVVAQMNIERAKVEIFKGEIDAYVAQLQAQKNEYDLYLAQIEGERAKIDIHKTEVEAYATRVNAVKVSNDVVVAQIESDIAIEEMNLRSHLANIDLYKAKSDQAISEIGQEADLYRTDGAIFETLLRHAQAQAEFNVQTQIRTEALTQANANMSLEAARANLQALLESNRIRVEASRGQANASSAMAGMIGGAIQGMLQLGGQGTSLETTES